MTNNNNTMKVVLAHFAIMSFAVTTEAFLVAPISHLSAKTATTTSSFPIQQPVGSRSSSTSSKTTATSLYMGNGGNFVERLFRVLNSNLNSAVSSIENPEKISVQAVTDMQSDLIKIRQAYAQAVASQRRFERQKEMPDRQADDWYRRANLAMRSGNEGLAREALARRQLYMEQSKSLQRQLETQTAATDKLYTAMKALESKIQEAAAKKEQLVARARTAKSTQQINDMLSGLTGKTSMDAFNRMEQKVQALEAAAEASVEGVGIFKVNDIVETEFLLLEQSSEVDDELQKLKMDMKLLSGAAVRTTTESSLPSVSSVSFDQPIRIIREESVPAKQDISYSRY
jgi:phage shock protein A